MSETLPIVCAGSVMWDIVGKTPHPLDRGSDEPGRISVIPGGVAMNIAMALRRFDLPVTLLTCLGQDRDGDTLIVEAAQRGIRTDFVYRAPDLSTDRYIAIEDETGMIAAVADAHSLEQGADKLLAPLHDGRLGDADTPWTGMIILDGNFRTEQLAEMAHSPVLRQADIRLAPASSGAGLARKIAQAAAVSGSSEHHALREPGRSGIYPRCQVPNLCRSRQRIGRNRRETGGRHRQRQSCQRLAGRAHHIHVAATCYNQAVHRCRRCLSVRPYLCGTERPSRKIGPAPRP